MWMQNPYKLAIQKFLLETMGDRYFSHVPLIDRMTHYLVTEADMQAFAKFASDLHSVGYLKAANEYNTMLESNGIKFVASQKKDSSQKACN